MHGVVITAVAVTVAAAENVLTTAVETTRGTHGIGYWGFVKDTKVTGKNIVTSVRVYDAEGGGQLDGAEDSKVRTLGRTVWITTKDIQHAILAILSNPLACKVNRILVCRILMEEPEERVADAIMQVACFGRVIYG